MLKRDPQGSAETSRDKRAYTVDQFMDAYGIRRTKTYEELKSGRLKARRVGGRTIIMREDADAWLASFPLLEARAA